MAAPPSTNLRRGQAIRGSSGIYNFSEKSSNRLSRRGSSVHFDETTSIFPLRPDEDSDSLSQQVGILRGVATDDDLQGAESEDRVCSKRCCYTYNTLLERPWVGKLFRWLSVINLLSLACSSPWQVCKQGSSSEWNECKGVFLQFVIITFVDFVVSVVFTIQLILATQCILFRCCQDNKKKLPVYDSNGRIMDAEHWNSQGQDSWHCWMGLASLVFVTASLWYSVGIGVYRSYVVHTYIDEIRRGVERWMASVPVLAWYFYVPLSLRSITAISSLKLIADLKIPATGVTSMITNIRHRWKQLLYVSIFYFFNVYIYALIGVQLLGGLNDNCFLVDEDTGISLTTSIPTTHCSILANDSISKRCFDNPNIKCKPNNDSGPLNFNYRNTVYLGQYRFIVDALFAVYEASSLELWSFMEYNGLSGSPRSHITPFFYYITMVFYLVIFVQQSIFLVVIIESFADLRSNEAGEASCKQQKKPTIVLSGQKGGTNEISFKDIETQESLTVFKNKRQKYYFRYFEKVFICFVLVDAVVMAFKSADMRAFTADVLKYWQLAVSIVFALEVLALFVFHAIAIPRQHLLFLKNLYFWFLTLTAFGGLVWGIEGVCSPDKFKAGNWLAVFQALRLLRVLRLVPQMKDFVSTIIGDGVRLIMIVLIVVIFLVWFAVVSMFLVGYLEPVQGCELLESDMFRDFFHSFGSMFQLLMQEGWSQLFSELQCRRDGVSYIINFYFILLHLIASLFLLNFFVAVILDNLDYDEEVKIKKLEEAEKNKERVQKVPKHLCIFQLGGPKKIPVPKLSSVDTPNLTEADVRNFYRVGEGTNLSSGFVAEQALSYPSEIDSRRSSKLLNLDLLMEDKGTVGGGISTHQGKYWGIQGILSHVKAFRQHSRENEGNRPSQSARGAVGGDFLGGRPQVDSSILSIQNQYDEYREKYRLFDRALFCLPPEHKLRRFCRAVLTKQLHGPTARPENLLSTEAILYVFQSIVSVLPFLNWFMLLVTCLALTGQLVEITVDTNVDCHSSIERDSCLHLPSYLVWVDILFVFFTLVELILKILANGVFFNPHAAIQGLWDVLDWLILLATLAVVVTYLVSCQAALQLRITYRNIPPWLLFLLTFRALRPLRLISIIPSIRRVMYELMLGLKKLVFAGILLLLFMFMFASLGVQLFTGTGSPEGFCNDPNRTNDDCVGIFNMSIVVSIQESLPLTNTSAGDTFILAPRVWYDYHRNFRFDDTFRAFITLFEVLTLEGWLDVRDLYGSSSDIFKNNKYSMFMFIYIHIFVFIGVNFGLQVFVGIVVNNFNENKPNHSALLTVSQKRWTDLLQRISLTRPIKKPSPPRNNKFRLFLYKIFVTSNYKHFVTFVISLNSCLFWMPWADSNGVLERYTTILMSLSVVMAALFFMEFLLKLLAFGPYGYFQSWRNVFDLLLSLLGVCYGIMSILYLTNRLNDIQMIADVALIFTVFKLFTILMKYSILQNLLRTVASTLLRSRAFLGVLISFLLAYTLVGNLYFSNVRSGEAIDFNLVTFMSFFPTFNLMIRVSTGEDWHTIFQDSMVSEPYCSDSLGTCGSTAFAFIFFLSFYVLFSFILLNVVIAVLLENFSIFYNEDDTELNHAVVRDFKQNWLYYDKSATGLISSGKIKLFLRMLKLNEFYTYDISENGIRERQKSNLLVDSILLREIREELRRDRKQPTVQAEAASSLGNQPTVEDKEHSIPFQDVLKMIAYRAEDISQRLVPHELYVREEFEKSVQFDVAEQCILKWIQKFVKPEKVRRQTMSHSAYRAIRRDESIWPPLVRTDKVEDGNRLDGLDQNPEDSEDELEPLRESYGNDQTWRKLQSLRSEDDGICDMLSSTASGGVARDKVNPAVAKSWIRLESAPYVHFKQQQQVGVAGGKDKWHEWFQMQKEWLGNVEQDPDNYFDDNL